MQLAVIFDVDGVLVDSYRAHFESWQKMLARHGGAISEEQFGKTFGRRSGDILREVHAKDLADETICEMDEEKEAMYREMIRREFPAMAGAEQLIRQLHTAGWALAAGSSGPPDNVHLTLDLLPAGELIGVRITGDDVEQGKPHPEVFLTAAARLGIAPRRCAVIEDAAPGIQAANAAGMTSIALLSTGHRREEFAEADVVVESLAELSSEAIATWIGV